MSANSKIEWTSTVQPDGTVTPGSTWNPIRGQNARHTCAKISPGCDNCYADTMTRRGLMGTAPIGYGTGETPNDPARLDEKALRLPLAWKKPRRIFVCSMTDLFGTWVPDEWIDRVFGVMAVARQHTFIVLTKRPTRMRDYLAAQTGEFGYGPRSRIWWSARRDCALVVKEHNFYDALKIGGPGRGPQGIYLRDWPLPNVWVGVTIESNQYVWRADRLRQTPAAVRWISAEPLLSGLPSLDLAGINWLVSGGESGPKARPSHPDWYRDLRDRCQTAGIAFFHKQWGEWAPTEISPGGDLGGDLRRGRTVHLHAEGNPEGYFRRGDAYVSRVGRKTAGRLLDGREWSEFPPVQLATPLTGVNGTER